MNATIIQRLLSASVEVVLAAAIVTAIAALIGRRAPRVVALLWLVVLAKPLVTLAGGALVRVPLPHLANVKSGREVQMSVVKQVGPAGATESVQTATTPDFTTAIPAIWLAGALLVFGRTLVNRFRLRAIVAATRPPAPRLANAYARLTQARVHPPRLRVSETLDGPAIGGVVRPVILLPSWMEEHADDEQIDWTLRHELRHATARDTLAIALREIALVVLWFHPAVWIAARRWEAAAELACDRDVVSNDEEAVGYADALLRTLAHVRQQPRLQLASGLFATRSKIGTRITALLERPLAPRIGRVGTMAAATLAVALIAVGTGFASRAGDGHHRGELEETNDERTAYLRYDFDSITTSDRVDALSPGGYVLLRETAGGTTRELRIDATDHAIRRIYSIDGRAAPPDREFERRLVKAIRRGLH